MYPGMDYEDPVQDLYIHLKPGLQVLNGKDARNLHDSDRYPDQDLGRIRHSSSLSRHLSISLQVPR